MYPPPTRSFQVRTEKEAIVEERRRVDDELNAVNKLVDAKRDNVQKVRSGLPYMREEDIQDQIRNLEYQLRKNHYRPAEEKKIIVEIDKLNRSKRLLKEHNALKVELDQLRTNQRRARERRDQLFRQRGDLNKREGNLKRDSREVREELDKLKVELDSLSELRRETVSAFRAHESEYKRFLYERREEQRTRRREEKEEREAEKQKELEEIKANAEPFEDEIKLISNLISYCLRFEFTTPSATTSSPVKSPSAAPVSNGFLAVPGGGGPGSRRGSHESRSGDSSIYATPASTPISGDCSSGSVGSGENCFVYKKEDADETLFAGVSKKSKKQSRNERRNSRAKLLNHNPEIYVQFGRFELKPPSTTKDVVSVVDALKEKQVMIR